jgi:hypothetical protein
MAASTQEQRAKHVAQMRANFGIEGMHPDADDLIWQQRYIDGAASIDDLLRHARDFVVEQRKGTLPQIVKITT